MDPKTIFYSTPLSSSTWVYDALFREREDVSTSINLDLAKCGTAASRVALTEGIIEVEHIDIVDRMYRFDEALEMDPEIHAELVRKMDERIEEMMFEAICGDKPRRQGFRPLVWSYYAPLPLNISHIAVNHILGDGVC